MTDSEICSLTSWELNIQVGVTLFGWNRQDIDDLGPDFPPDVHGVCMSCPPSRHHHTFLIHDGERFGEILPKNPSQFLPSYSNSINRVFEVVEEMSRRGHSFSLFKDQEGWHALFDDSVVKGRDVKEAICRAALLRLQ